jgi:hypothetical protein
MYHYVVTADDVGTLLAVDCTPMDDNGRQVIILMQQLLFLWTACPSNYYFVYQWSNQSFFD